MTDFFSLDFWKKATLKDLDGIDVKSSDKNGKSVLMYAAHKTKNIEVIQKLLDLGADINEKTKRKETVLCFAILNPCDEILSFLIEHGADVNSEEAHGKSILLKTLEKEGNIKKVEILINSGANIKFIWLNIPLIYFAIDIEYVKLLKKKGININKIEKDGMNLFLNSCIERNFEFIQGLFELGLDKKLIYSEKLDEECKKLKNFKNMGHNSLYYSINNPDIRVPLYLMNLMPDEMIEKAMLCEGRFDRPEVIIPMLDKCPAIVQKRDDLWQQTVIYKAIIGNNLEIVSKIISLGADLNVVDRLGRTPLEFASEYQTKLEIIKKLVDSGAEINARILSHFKKSGWGETNYNFLEKIAQQEQDGNQNIQKEGITENKLLISDFWIGCKVEDVERELSVCSNLNQVDGLGKNFLMYAFENNDNEDVNKYLLENFDRWNLDLSVQDKKKKTVFDYAIKFTSNQMKKESFVKLFIDKQAPFSKANELFVLKKCIFWNDEKYFDSLVEKGIDQKKVCLAFYELFSIRDVDLALYWMKKLLKLGVDINFQKNGGGISYLMYSLYNSKKNALFYELLSLGADVNVTDNEGNTALYYASMYQHWDEFLCLLEHNANINHQDNEGNPIAFNFIRHISYDFFLKLLDCGLDVKLKNNVGKTLLMIAAEGEQEGASLIVKKLIELGLRKKDKTKGGNDALDYCLLNDRGNSEEKEKIKKILRSR